MNIEMDRHLIRNHEIYYTLYVMEEDLKNEKIVFDVFNKE